LTAAANKSSICYGLYNEIDEIIGIICVLHFPCTNKRLKKCSRLVILPDYQGIGLGSKFLDEVAKIYILQGFDFAITTTAKNLVSSLCRNKNWMLTRYGKEKPSLAHAEFIGALPRNAKTYTFFAKPSIIS